MVASLCLIRYLFLMNIIDLARAKNEALFNIYSLLNQNIKSCNAKETAKTTRTVKTTTISVKQQKCKTLHVQYTFLSFCTTTT